MRGIWGYYDHEDGRVTDAWEKILNDTKHCQDNPQEFLTHIEKSIMQLEPQIGNGVFLLACNYSQNGTGMIAPLMASRELIEKLLENTNKLRATVKKDGWRYYALRIDALNREYRFFRDIKRARWSEDLWQE